MSVETTTKGSFLGIGADAKYSFGIELGQTFEHTWSKSETTEKTTTDGFSSTKSKSIDCAAEMELPPYHRAFYTLQVTQEQISIPSSNDLKLTLCSAYIDGDNTIDDSNPDEVQFVYDVPGDIIQVGSSVCNVLFTEPELLTQSLDCGEQQVISWMTGSTWMPNCNEDDPSVWDGCQCDTGDSLTNAPCYCVTPETGAIIQGTGVHVETLGVSHWQFACGYLDCEGSIYRGAEYTYVPPTNEPTKKPTPPPTKNPTPHPTESPTRSPTKQPTYDPTKGPTVSPTKNPTKSPTESPTRNPTKQPTVSPTTQPTVSPSQSPTKSPSQSPSQSPTKQPTDSPTEQPTRNPSVSPSKNPTASPSDSPTRNPTLSPTLNPTKGPTKEPTRNPTRAPSHTEQRVSGWDVEYVLDQTTFTLKPTFWAANDPHYYEIDVELAEIEYVTEGRVRHVVKGQDLHDWLWTHRSFEVSENDGGFIRALEIVGTSPTQCDEGNGNNNKPCTDVLNTEIVFYLFFDAELSPYENGITISLSMDGRGWDASEPLNIDYSVATRPQDVVASGGQSLPLTLHERVASKYGADAFVSLEKPGSYYLINGGHAVFKESQHAATTRPVGVAYSDAADSDGVSVTMQPLSDESVSYSLSAALRKEDREGAPRAGALAAAGDERVTDNAKDSEKGSEAGAAAGIAVTVIVVVVVLALGLVLVSQRCVAKKSKQVDTVQECTEATGVAETVQGAMARAVEMGSVGIDMSDAN